MALLLGKVSIKQSIEVQLNKRIQMEATYLLKHSTVNRVQNWRLIWVNPVKGNLSKEGLLLKIKPWIGGIKS